MKIKGLSFFSNLIAIVVILTACTLLAYFIVWPVWKIATSFKNVYTIISLSLIAAALLWIIYKAIRKHSLKSILKFSLNIIILLGGIIFSLQLLFSEKRLAALIVIIITIVIMFILHFVWKKINEKK